MKRKKNTKYMMCWLCRWRRHIQQQKKSQIKQVTKNLKGCKDWKRLIKMGRFSCLISGPRYRRPKKEKPKDAPPDEKRPRTAFSTEQLARLKVRQSLLFSRHIFIKNSRFLYKWKKEVNAYLVVQGSCPKIREPVAVNIFKNFILKNKTVWSQGTIAVWSLWSLILKVSKNT